MILEVRPTRHNPHSPATIARLATERKQASHYPELRHVSYLASDGCVAIVGEVTSYYLMQLAQAWLIEHSQGSVTIQNQLEITGSSRRTGQLVR